MNGIAITKKVNQCKGHQTTLEKEVAYTKKEWTLKKMSINCFMKIFSLKGLNKHAIP